MGEEGVSTLTAALRAESEDRLAANLERSHTNPVQLDAAYGLTTAGSAAIPTLTNLLEDESWGLRASAADTLGDMGHVAAPAGGALARVLDDESAWVRRNAVEALGNIGPLATAAAPALSECLSDHDVTVRHNAALALAKMGAGDTSLLQQASADEDHYVRELAGYALSRQRS
jgi:HEAT repeat protein